MTITFPGVATGRARGRTSSLAERPWILPAAGAAVGWALVVLVGRSPGHGHVHHLLGVTAMSIAMMSPLAYPACLAAARSSLWSSSAQCVLAAFAAFLAVWVAAGAVLHVGTELLLAAMSPAAVTAALALWCAFDALSRRRAQRLAACVRTRPLLPGAATSGAIDLGATAGLRCLGTCWAVMALAVAIPALAIPVAAVILVERLVEPRPRWALAAAFALVAVAAMTTIWR